MIDSRRFWNKVDGFMVIDECWIWRGSRRGAYGMFEYTEGGKRHRVLAHRQAWIFLHGALDRWTLLHHTCRNKLCVNTRHLEAVSATLHPRKDDRDPTGQFCLRGHKMEGHNLRPHVNKRGTTVLSCRACWNMARRARRLLGKKD